MNPDPFHDVVHFLAQPGWPTPVFWLLLGLSVVIALYDLAAIPGQLGIGQLGAWLFRLSIGAMWWQQTLWKLPPYYTNDPHSAFGASGLAYWMIQMGKHAAIPLQADLVNHVVLPHFYLFAPVVYGLEVLTAASLMLGFWVRLFAFLGALQILNLWLGLYSAPGEWPWTYFFLLVLQLIFSLNHYGRALGIDAVLAARSPRSWFLAAVA